MGYPLHRDENSVVASPSFPALEHEVLVRRDEHVAAQRVGRLAARVGAAQLVAQQQLARGRRPVQHEGAHARPRAHLALPVAEGGERRNHEERAPDALPDEAVRT